jgi:hypothetical protein
VLAVFVVQDPDESINGEAGQNQGGQANGAGKREDRLERRMLHRENPDSTLSRGQMSRVERPVEASAPKRLRDSPDGRCQIRPETGAMEAAKCGRPGLLIAGTRRMQSARGRRQAYLIPGEHYRRRREFQGTRFQPILSRTDRAIVGCTRAGALPPEIDAPVSAAFGDQEELTIPMDGEIQGDIS